jgi:hypothetical protein
MKPKPHQFSDHTMMLLTVAQLVNLHSLHDRIWVSANEVSVLVFKTYLTTEDHYKDNSNLITCLSTSCWL